MATDSSANGNTLPFGLVLLLLIVVVASALKLQVYDLANTHHDRLPASSHTGPYILRRRFPSWMKQVFTIVLVGVTMYQLVSNFEFMDVMSRLTHVLFAFCMTAVVYLDDVQNLPFIKRKLLWMVSYILSFVYCTLGFTADMSTPSMLALVFSILAFVSAMLCAALDLKAMQIHPPNAEYSCNLWNYITFSYLNNTLIGIARVKKTLEFEDVPTFVDADSAEQLYDRFKLILSSHGDKPNIVNAVWSLVYYEWLTHGFCQLIASSCMYLTPLALERILLHISHSGRDDDEVEALFPISIQMAVLMLFVGPMVKGIAEGQGYHRGRHIGIRAKAALIGLVYAKAMKVDLSASKESVGKLNNLISVDVGEIQSFCAYSHYLWCTPYEILICCVLLFLVLGQAAWGGILLMISALYVGYLIQHRMEAYQKQMMEHKDTRMGIINEVLNSIRVIKFYAWEVKFMDKINEARKAELKSLKNYGLCQIAMMATWEAVPALVGVCSFLIHVYLLGKPLSPAMGFTSVALFNILRSPLMLFPEVVNYVIKSSVSMKRIVSFVESSDVKGLPDRHNNSNNTSRGAAGVDQSSTGEGYVEMSSVSLSWPSVPSETSDQSSSDKVSSVGEPSGSGLDMAENVSSCCVRWSGGCCASTTAALRNKTSSNSGSNINNSSGEKAIPLMDRRPSSFVPSSGGAKYAPLSTSEESSNQGKSTISTKFTIEEDEESGTSASELSSPTGSTYNRVVLEEVSFSIPPKSLAVVVGMTGSGKSTLLQGGLLGEALHLRGRTVLNGAVSYASQSAWIQNATLKDNILFGSPFDQDRYDKVLFACSLLPDLKLLPAGDMTEIGEKGVNLSGGQQQRVSLARAAYSRSSIILLDDPLSAVDAHVGEHIFKELIVGFLRDRTKVLVSHNLTLTVPRADLVVCVDHCTHSVVACCPPLLLPATLRDNKALLLANTSCRGSLSSFWEGLLSVVAANSPTNSSINSDGTTSDGLKPLSLKRLISPPIASPDISGFSKHRPTPRPSHLSRDDSCDSQNYDEEPGSKSASAGSIVEVETKAAGDVSLQVYLFYLLAAGGVLVFAALLSGLVGVYLFNLLLNYSLGRWMEEMQAAASPSTGSSLNTYLLFVSLVFAATAFKLLTMLFTSVKAAKTLHDNLITSVVLSPMRWFDATPIGRIINRFSQDIGTVDTSTMFHITWFLECILGTAQIVCVISFNLPLLLLPFIPIILFTTWVAYQYMLVSRELKRLESLKKSPVFVLFSESLAGLSTIRSFRQESRFFKTCCTRVDEMNKCHMYLWLCNRWLNFRMQVLGAIVIGSVGLAVILFENSIDSTTAAIVIIYSLSFCDFLTFLARGYSEVQMEMNSVERIQEYSSLDTEDYKQDLTLTDSSTSSSAVVSTPISRSTGSPRATRAGKGRVEFRKLFMKYHTSSVPVLRAISFVIPSKVKVGVVGRTGAGKSSLIAALFRLVEPYSGEMLIDDLDALQMPLHELRSNISIVPQEPTLFKGSLRFNLDPFDQFSDDQLWAALRSVHLAEHILTMENSNDETSEAEVGAELSGSNSSYSGRSNKNLRTKQVSEKGSNFSVGQRQLLCMARAILRGSAVLVLDECTASVDHETDSLIQDTVRSQLSNTTVICIAHRLRTIAYYDLILVMDKGSVAEMDHPYTLISRERSLFRGMCVASGEFEDLLAMSKEAFENGGSSKAVQQQETATV